MPNSIRTVLLSLAFATGCGDSSEDQVADEGPCIPGESVACTCAGGEPGAEVCSLDGAFGPCVCGGEETGEDSGDGSGSGESDGDTTSDEAESTDAESTDADDSTSTDGDACPGAIVREDDFERPELGTDWGVLFGADQVQILAESDLGMVPGPQGFMLVNWRADSFADDQFSEAEIPLDVNPDWLHQVYVRWREADGARYGFGYNGDPNQASFEQWYFKYDGVPSQDTRVFATADATDVPGPGDSIRLEVSGYLLRGYFNGELVLEATDVDPSKIAGGEPGLAARWAEGNMQTQADSKVWEWWAGGDLCE